MVMRSSSTLPDFLFFPPCLLAIFPRGRDDVGGRRNFGSWLDKVWREGDIHGAVHHRLEDLVKGDKAVVHHQPILELDALSEPTLNANFHGV